MPSRLINRNVYAERLRTSIRLEPEFWNALRDICARENISMRQLVSRIERRTGNAGGRTSAVRVFVLEYFRAGADRESDFPANRRPALMSKRRAAAPTFSRH